MLLSGRRRDLIREPEICVTDTIIQGLVILFAGASGICSVPAINPRFREPAGLPARSDNLASGGVRSWKIFRHSHRYLQSTVRGFGAAILAASRRSLL